MPYVVIAVVLIFLSVIGIGISKSFSQAGAKPPVTSQKVKGSTRGQLDEMLKLIEAKDAPEQKMGAMCYDSALGPKYLEYVCPIDGEKTAYDRDNFNAYMLIENIVEMRRVLARANAITDLVELRLDETRMCHKHFPNLKDDQRSVSLVVTYPDKKEYVCEKVTLEDLRMLAAFFEKKLSYTGDRESEIPLKGHLDRIKQMLGIAKS